MPDSQLHSSKQLLKNAKTILLVDWPDQAIPITLIKAGFTVFSYSPGKYSAAVLEDEKLVFRALDVAPEQVDIVNVFRPEAEHESIVAAHILPLKAKVLWLHPPVMSVKTAGLAAKNDLVFVEGIDIADVAKAIRAG